MDLTTLPDLCLLQIFDYLSPSQLLALDQICLRFGKLQSAACSRRRVLQLVINRPLESEPENLFDRTFFRVPYQDELEQVSAALPSQVPPNIPELIPENPGKEANKHEYNLFYSQLTHAKAVQLGTLFSNISHLKLAIKINYQHYLLPNNSFIRPENSDFWTRSSDTDTLLSLLSAWAPTLSTFNLSCHYDYHFYWDNLREHQEVNLEISRQLLSILSTVNRMSSLRSLALVFSNYFNLDPSYQHLDLSILSRLREFYFFSYDSPRMLLPSLKRYAMPNPNLISLGINSEPYLHRKDYSRVFLDLPPSFARKFTRISRVYYPFSEEMFSSFTSLTSLQLEQNFDLSEHLSLSQLADKLSKLTQLIHLRLHLITTADRTLAHDDDLDASRWIPRLPSIRVLQLHLSGSSHLDAHSRHFGWIFPEVAILQVQFFHWQCLPCRYDLRQSTPLKQQIKCYQKAIEPWWAQAGKLKKVYAFIWAEGRYLEIEPKKEKVTTMEKFKRCLKQIL